MTGDLLASLRRWESLSAERARVDAEMREAAEPLEDAARRVIAGRVIGSVSTLADLVGQDRDGRVRFTVRGFGQRTFTLEELGDGA